MFNKLFRKYNQNNKTILTVIIFVAFFIILLHFINNNIAKNKTKEYKNSSNNSNINQSSNYLNNNITSNNSYSSNTQGNISNINYSASKIINSFVNYCNNNQVEEAYNMLSTDCKKALFQTQNDFKNNYYDKVFTKERSAKVESSMYGASVYKVTYYADLLSSGYNKQDTLQDYIYIVDENNEKRLNISQFLYADNIDKSQTTSDITIKIVKKSVYLNYESYEVQITNNSANKILIAEKEKQDSIYITDENNINHSANIGEIVAERLVLSPKEVSFIELRFDKIYNQGKNSKSINFTEIIKNYEQYQKGEETEKSSLSISW